jgi:hypothetical protein
MESAGYQPDSQLVPRLPEVRSEPIGPRSPACVCGDDLY